MRWIWVRHGETEANVKGCYLGHIDSPLTKRGYEQAEIVAERIAEIFEKRIPEDVSINDAKSFSSLGEVRLYTSDLGRCTETASIIGKRLAVEATPDSRLRELDFGQWEGRTYDEVMCMDQELMRRWYDDPFTLAPPDGETLNQLGHRVDEWFVEKMDVPLTNRTTGATTDTTYDAETNTSSGTSTDNETKETTEETTEETIIVVTHGGPIRWFQSRWLLQDRAAYWKVAGVPPGEKVIVDYEIGRIRETLIKANRI